MTPFNSFLGQSQEPHIPLLFFTFVAVFFLFFTAFNVPFINSVYFVKVNLNSGLETVTLGTFGFCWEVGGSKECSSALTGYQLDDTLLQSPLILPSISSAMTKALVLHVIAFMLALATTTIILCTLFKSTPMAKWITEITVLLALITMASFVVDLVLFSSTKKAFEAHSASVQIGNGAWFTLTSVVALLVGICTFVLQRRLVSTTVPRRTQEHSSKVLPDLPRDLEAMLESNEPKDDVNFLRPFLITANQHHANQHSPKAGIANLSDSPHVTQRTSRPSLHSQPADETDFQMDNSIGGGHLSLSPVRSRGLPDILINGFPDISTQSGPVGSMRVPSPSQGPPSAYAPSTYSTYRTESSRVSMQTNPDNILGTIGFTTTTLSRSSTMRSGSFPEGQYASQRSTPEPYRPHSWLNNKTRTIRKNSQKSGYVSPALPQFLSSVSTLESVIHQFPLVPAPQPTYLPYSHYKFGGRFVERAGIEAYAAERHLSSAAASSDLELYVETLAAQNKQSVDQAPTRNSRDQDEISIA